MKLTGNLLINDSMMIKTTMNINNNQQQQTNVNRLLPIRLVSSSVLDTFTNVFRKITKHESNAVNTNVVPTTTISDDDNNGTIVVVDGVNCSNSNNKKMNDKDNKNIKINNGNKI